MWTFLNDMVRTAVQKEKKHTHQRARMAESPKKVSGPDSPFCQRSVAVTFSTGTFFFFFFFLCCLPLYITSIGLASKELKEKQNSLSYVLLLVGKKESANEKKGFSLYLDNILKTKHKKWNVTLLIYRPYNGSHFANWVMFHMKMVWFIHTCRSIEL